MENASKALIMAAGVLIGIMVLALIAYIFTLFGSFAKEKDEQAYAKILSEFNNQFLKFQGVTDITAQDIVTLINLAKDNNKRYDVTKGESSYIEIKFNGINKEEETNTNDFIKTYAFDANGATRHYKCSNIEIDEKSKKVKKVEFTN